MSFKAGWELADSIAKWWNKPKVKAKRSKPADQEVLELIDEVNEVYQNTEVLKDLNSYNFAVSIPMQSAMNLDLPPDNPLIDSMIEVVYKYAEYEGLYGINPDFLIPETHAEKSLVKQQLRRNLAVYENEEEVMYGFVHFFHNLFTEIYQSLPKSCIRDNRSQENDNPNTVFDTHILNLIDDVYELVERICIEFYHDDLKDLQLFDKTRDILQVNGMLFAGLDPKKDYGKDFPFPTQCRKIAPDVMVKSFFYNTPLPDVFLQKLPFEIPASVRFEHMHVLAGSGHGKTQLLQKLILDDLNNDTGFCVIDSQGDLISKLLLNKRFSPTENPDIADKLILIDASDVEYPACLNLFSMNKTDEKLGFKQKEILSNNTVDLYTYIFSSLLGAELTARQGTMFVYIAKLMMEIPNASIQTLRELMEDGQQFQPYMNKLEGSAKAFFKTQFFSKTFSPVKQQILYRLWAVLSNSVLERMFSGQENKVDLYRAMNDGKIVLINTSKQVLGKIGSEVMGKFFIAMLTQSALKRASIKEQNRRGFHIYIDEAQEYVDDMFNQFLNQTRKYKCGFHLFHQNYDQLPATVKASILSSTSIKFAGGVSSKDARILTEEMKIPVEQIMSVKKYDRSHSEYSLYVQNVTSSAVTVDVPFGLLEQEPVMGLNEYQKLVDDNREKYCRHISQVQIEEKPEVEEVLQTEKQLEVEPINVDDIVNKVESRKTEPTTRKEKIAEPVEATEPARGGTKHRYLQALIQRYGNELGFVVSVEEQTSDGKGFIDVVLKKDSLKIAVETSVTNTPEYELSNIVKCLNENFDHVFMVSSDGQHLKKIYKKAEESLKLNELAKVQFCTDDDVVQRLKKLLPGEPEDTEVRSHGYKVNLKVGKLSDAEKKAKDKAISKILFNSMKK